LILIASIVAKCTILRVKSKTIDRNLYFKIHSMPSRETQDLHLFDYDLPDDLIARHPLAERSDSRLLFYNQGKIEHEYFRKLPDLLPSNSLLIFNQSKVIPARLIGQTANKRQIEILLLKPIVPSKDPLFALQNQLPQVWECMVGGKKYWKENDSVTINAGDWQVKFEWEDRVNNYLSIKVEGANLPFGVVLEKLGEMPLPPYLNRKAEQNDALRYQTVYSTNEGSVAAPTAGLHFDADIMEQLKQKGHSVAYLTLHVGAGTFLPVKTQNMLEHPMHSEQFVIEESLLRTISQHEGPIIPVGTTSMRALESLRFLLDNDTICTQVPQFPYCNMPQTNRRKVSQKLLRYLNNYHQTSLLAETSIMIHPGFVPMFSDGIVTNFHQPKSTLLLLIASLIGEDWKKVYDSALAERYRFLSYGDSSFLFWNSDLPAGRI
jgi:S-adenosylmethionine:tRNA ribosyltransferase-isomerase